MPQFDHVSFSNQVFWLLFFFINFYFFITYFFLPVLAKNLKFRKKKLYTTQYSFLSLDLENTSNRVLKINNITNIFHKYLLLLSNISKNTKSLTVPFKSDLLKNLNSIHNIKTFYITVQSFPKFFK